MNCLTRTPKKIGETLFTKKAELPEGFERVALKGVHINKSPALAPLNTLSAEQAEKWQIDRKQLEANRQRILYFDGLESKIHQIYATASQNAPANQDADGALYQGFITRNERKICDQVLARSVEDRVSWTPPFQDERLQSLYARYLGRNWPELLSEEQSAEWQRYVTQKLIDGEFGCQFTLDDYFAVMGETEAENESQAGILEQLEAWVDQHYSDLGQG